jgi:hypothetical protein
MIRSATSPGRVIIGLWVESIPEPWAWTPWQYATDGRFTGRWDDPDVARTLCVGDTE